MRDSELAYNLREAHETKEIERTGHIYEEEEERCFEPDEQTRDLIVELLEIEEKINNIRKFFTLEEIEIVSKENDVKIAIEYQSGYDCYLLDRKDEDYVICSQLVDGELEIGEKF
jgi:hypothetical protein